MSAWPRLDSSVMFAGPCHSFAAMKIVRPSGPPGAHAKAPRSTINYRPGVAEKPGWLHSRPRGDGPGRAAGGTEPDTPSARAT